MLIKKSTYHPPKMIFRAMDSVVHCPPIRQHLHKSDMKKKT